MANKQKHVCLTAEAAEMYDRDTVTIHVVFDVRLIGGVYFYKVAPLTSEGLDYARSFELAKGDVVEVGL
jgi:hypothetical protein